MLSSKVLLSAVFVIECWYVGVMKGAKYIATLQGNQLSFECQRPEYLIMFLGADIKKILLKISN